MLAGFYAICRHCYVCRRSQAKEVIFLHFFPPLSWYCTAPFGVSTVPVINKLFWQGKDKNFYKIQLVTCLILFTIRSYFTMRLQELYIFHHATARVIYISLCDCESYIYFTMRLRELYTARVIYISPCDCESYIYFTMRLRVIYISPCDCESCI